MDVDSMAMERAARLVAGNVGLAGIYFVAAVAGLKLATVHESVTLVWPPSGIALAAVVLHGPALLPGVAVGAFAANVWSGAPLAFSPFPAVGNTLAAALAAWLLCRQLHGQNPMQSVRGVAALLVQGAGASTLVSATIGTTGLTLLGLTAPAEAAGVFWVWWIGDALGVLAVAPALLCCLGPARPVWGLREWTQAGLYLTALGLTCSSIFGEALSSATQNLPLAFVPFAIVGAMALRLDSLGAALGVLATATAAVLATAQGNGPFGGLEPSMRFWMLGPFIGSLAVATLLLGASASERRGQRKELQRSNEELEQLVRERTFELEQTQERLERTNRRLQELATRDGLTGLVNRRSFDERLTDEHRRAARNSRWFSVILADIDDFKAYNDSFGHPRGDECLQQVARAIAHSVKRGGDLVARFGGEEFAILLPETHPLGAEKVAEQIRAQVEALRIPHPRSKTEGCVTISLGVASCLPVPGLSERLLVALADERLYEAKENGRNCVQTAVFEQGSGTTSSRR